MEKVSHALKRAMAHHNGGRLDQAEAIYREILLVEPAQADALHLLGLVAHQTGNDNDAVDLIGRAIERKPDQPDFRGNLGIVFHKLGRLGEAVSTLRRAADLKPDNAEAQANLGAALYENLETEEAVDAFRRALALDPGNVRAHNNLGLALAALDRFDEALAEFRRALEIEPDHTLAWRNLAKELGRAKSLDNPERLRRELIGCLSLPYVDHGGLARTGLRLLNSDAGVRKFLSAARKSESELISALQSEAALSLFRDELFQSVLENVRLNSATMEAMLREARRLFLHAAVDQGAPFFAAADATEFMCALAHQCFLNEYVYFRTAEEAAEVDQLRVRVVAALERPGTASKADIALLGSYGPLGALPSSDALLDLIDAEAPGRFERLIIRQVREPLDERAIRDAELRASTVTDATSRLVRDQYETNPYPRWVSLEIGESRTVPMIMQGLFPHLADTDFATAKAPKVLIAGCGTGKHAITSARRFKGSEVLAVDLSLTSLSYAKRKAREFAIDNLTFAHKDILALSDLDERFDLIESVGVLHHLEVPLRGWRILVDLLKPQGLMKIGLYSEHARRAIVAARSLVADHGYEATSDGIRQFRHDILALPDDDVAKRVLRFDDFFTLSSCRDLIFHVQEHRFTLPQIAKILNEFELKFLGFELTDNSVRKDYLNQFPQDPTATDLACWDLYEQANPDTFLNMYQFWTQKPRADS